jgi:hypothetical protein
MSSQATLIRQNLVTIVSNVAGVDPNLVSAGIRDMVDGENFFLVVGPLTPTLKQKTSGIVTLTVPNHYLAGDSISVALSPADVHFDGASQIVTASTPTTVSYTLAGGDIASASTGGVITCSPWVIIRPTEMPAFSEFEMLGTYNVEIIVYAGFIYDANQNFYALEDTLFAIRDAVADPDNWTSAGVAPPALGITIEGPNNLNLKPVVSCWKLKGSWKTC